MSAFDIVDIRSDAEGLELKRDIRSGLNNPSGKKTLPTLLLYDEVGLRLFEKVTYLDDYYLTREEVAVLKKHADSIAEQVPEGAIVLELGSGNLRKVRLLLDAFERAQKNVQYFALDVMKAELERTLAECPTYKYVKCTGLNGTYDDGLVWLQKPEIASVPKVVLSMGSSIGNFPLNDAAAFLAQFAGVLSLQDRFLIGLDGCQEPKKVHQAYNDSKGVTHEFTLNGLKHANQLLGYDAFCLDNWQAVGEYDVVGHRHRAFVAPLKDQVVEGVEIEQGEKVRIEESYKANASQAKDLWRNSCVEQMTRWSNDADYYSLYLLRPELTFSDKPEKYAKNPLPSLHDWQQLWTLWDTVTRQMIPEKELYRKPIDLRNSCIFYVGHIPTFVDLKLTETIGGQPTPHEFAKIFERGIDPDVDDPTHCHSHSEIPDEWPALQSILEFQSNVRERIISLYTSGQAYENRRAARGLWLGYEHEAMHIETLLYMLIQSSWVQPPAIAPQPDFQKLSQVKAVDNEWFDIPKQTITSGISDPDDSSSGNYFGWDCEKPVRTVVVGAFKSKARPITVGEFAEFMKATGRHQYPKSWTDDGRVRTVYGPIDLRYASDWPVAASYDELNACAKYMGGRIPKANELRSVFQYAERSKKETPHDSEQKIPAVNGHLINNGVPESPPEDLFVDLSKANVAFKHWHPIPVTQKGSRLTGQSEAGGVWEWTSTVFEKHDGFVPMSLYPGFSADFFDGKHNVVLGGSWATIPRIAGRKSFVNWYQRNYKYAWAGARVVKDV
ncbi:DUF323 domain protein [Piedraia hortae CBS 480.64]|uniref:DUF323 domain protein n=1 Tax=Piedraia hortae CBS 480.64 TaxID=1314780 RepID=A0A6A7BX22_9PEZI|nr:DUF323 domain protein [Piedraia hortae CBS 480.64]